MKIILPEGAKVMIAQLEQKGCESYVVGGCVRDSLLQKIPYDWDICTAALPQQVCEILRDYPIIQTGLKHGTVTVLYQNTPYEVTTFRTDGEYLDHRRPKQVAFITNLKEDLARRDFTINAIAYHPKKGIIDPFFGEQDLKGKCIRCVGSPKKRFEEDALRIMRALRFASVLGFKIEDQTALAIHQQSDLLQHIAKERIQSELCRCICGSYTADIFRAFPDVLSQFIPELTTCLHGDLWERTLISLHGAFDDCIVRLAILFYGIAKSQSSFTNDIRQQCADITHQIMKRLKFKNEWIHQVKQLVFWYGSDPTPDTKQIKTYLHQLGPSLFEKFIRVKQADTLWQTPEKRQAKQQQLSQVERLNQIIIQQKQCFSLKDLAIHGTDLISLGFSGKEIGYLLNALLQKVIQEELENKREVLLKFIQEKGTLC